MSPSERAAAKREAELTEALGHLEYFSRKGEAIRAAIKQLMIDQQLCAKEQHRWEGRIEAMKAKAAKIVEVLG